MFRPLRLRPVPHTLSTHSRRVVRLFTVDKSSATSGDHKPSPRAEDERGAWAAHAVLSWSERSAVVLRKRTDDIVARMKASFSQLGGNINRVTGYEEIEALKRSVVSQEARIAEAREKSRDTKTAYAEAVQQRSNSQREVNDLLQRKHTWKDADVGRFTALVRQDHLYEQEEARAKDAVAASDDEVDREFSALMRLILARYHEEQVWSDKIRSVSTYGQLAVMGVNVFVFLLAIVLVEPWKRRRLAQTFERKVEELEASNVAVVKGGIRALDQRLDEQQQTLSRLVAASAATPLETASHVGDGPSLVEAHPYTLSNEDVAFVASSAAFTAAVLGWVLRGWFHPGP